MSGYKANGVKEIPDVGHMPISVIEDPGVLIIGRRPSVSDSEDSISLLSGSNNEEIKIPLSAKTYKRGIAKISYSALTSNDEKKEIVDIIDKYYGVENARMAFEGNGVEHKIYDKDGSLYLYTEGEEIPGQGGYAAGAASKKYSAGSKTPIEVAEYFRRKLTEEKIIKSKLNSKLGR